MAEFRRAGKFSIWGVSISDLADNWRTYDQAELRAMGEHSVFWLYRDSHREQVAPKLLKKPARGTQTGAPADLAADDDSYVTMSGQRKTDWTAVFSQVPNGTHDLTVTFKGKSDVPCLNRLYIRNFNSDAWELLDERTIGPDEVEVAGLVPPQGWTPWYITNPTGPGFVWVRNTCEAASPFTTSTDVLTIDWDAG